MQGVIFDHISMSRRFLSLLNFTLAFYPCVQCIIPSVGWGVCSPGRTDSVTTSVRGSSPPLKSTNEPTTVPVGPRLLMTVNSSVEEISADMVDRLVVFDNTFELSVHPSTGWLGEDEGEDRVGFRARRVDMETGMPVIPRSLR